MTNVQQSEKVSQWGKLSCCCGGGPSKKQIKVDKKIAQTFQLRA